MGVSKESDVTVAAVLFLATKRSKSYRDKRGPTLYDPLTNCARGATGLNSSRRISSDNMIRQYGCSILGSINSAKYFDEYLKLRKTHRLQTWRSESDFFLRLP